MSEELRLAVLVFAALPATLFPVVYAFSPWYASPVGRSLMTLAVGLGLMVDNAVARAVWGQDYPGAGVVLALVYIFVIGGLWFHFLVLLRYQHGRRRDRRRVAP